MHGTRICLTICHLPEQNGCTNTLQPISGLDGAMGFKFEKMEIDFFYNYNNLITRENTFYTLIMIYIPNFANL